MADTFTRDETRLIVQMSTQGFEYTGRDERGVLMFNLTTPSDDWTDEDWAEFEAECDPEPRCYCEDGACDCTYATGGSGYI